MSTDEERRILDDIKKTGYPLEVDVARSLMEKGWSVFPQWVYSDERTKKIRTIDMLAMPFVTEPTILLKPEPTILLKQQNIYRAPILILECKKSKKPWVFFTATELFKDSIQDSKLGLDQLLLTSLIITWLSLVKSYLDPTESQIDTNIINSAQRVATQKIHFFNANLPRAHFCHVAHMGDGKEDAPSDFQKAVYQIGGATLQVTRKFPKTPIFTAVIFRGKLFEYVRKGEKLRRVKHLLHTTLQTMPETQELPYYYVPPMMIDIVEDTYFPEYLELLKKDIQVLEQIHKIFTEKKKRNE